MKLLYWKSESFYFNNHAKALQGHIKLRVHKMLSWKDVQIPWCLDKNTQCMSYTLRQTEIMKVSKVDESNSLVLYLVFQFKSDLYLKLNCLILALERPHN